MIHEEVHQLSASKEVLIVQTKLGNNCASFQIVAKCESFFGFPAIVKRFQWSLFFLNRCALAI